jgi:hypothetical protein
VWVPGSDAVAAPNGSGFKLPAGATLRLDIRYKKGWRDEQKTLTDRSTVGLYFADAAAGNRDIQSVSIDRPGASARTFTGASLAADATVVAVRPSLDQPYAAVEVNAITPDGRRVPLLRLHGARPEWPRRYWLESPIALAKGSALEAAVIPQVRDPDDPPAATGPPFNAVVEFVMR